VGQAKSHCKSGDLALPALSTVSTAEINCITITRPEVLLVM